MHLSAPRLRTWHQFVHLLQFPKLTAILSTTSTSTALGPSREFRARATTGASITLGAVSKALQFATFRSPCQEVPWAICLGLSSRATRRFRVPGSTPLSPPRLRRFLQVAQWPHDLCDSRPTSGSSCSSQFLIFKLGPKPELPRLNESTEPSTSDPACW